MIDYNVYAWIDYISKYTWIKISQCCGPAKKQWSTMTCDAHDFLKSKRLFGESPCSRSRNKASKL